MDDYSSVAMGNQATVAMDHQPTVATDNHPTVAMDNNSQAAVAVDNQTEAVVDNKQAVMEKAAVVPAGGGTVATDDDGVLAEEVAGGNDDDEDGSGATTGREEEKKKKVKKEKKEEKKKKRRRSKKKQKNAKKKTPPGQRATAAAAAAQPADEAEGVRVKKCQRGERRRWDKSHYCVFCRRPQMKIGRHLLVAHRTEAEVQKAAAFAKGSKQRLLLLEQLRCRGDYRHNIEVIRRGQGEIVTCRQPSQEVNASDFLPCTLCLGFFLKDDLWKHMATCRRKTGGVPADPGPLGLTDTPPGGGAIPAGRKRRRVQADASRLLPISDGATEKCSDIIHRMHHDPVSQQVKCDWLICQYGSRLMGAGQEVKYDAVSQRMRELARFLLVVKSLDAGVRSLSELLEPDRVELAVNAARQALGSRPRKLLAVLRAVCDITVTEKMASGDWASAAMVTEFSERLTSVWDKQTAPVVGGAKWKRPASVQSGSELFRVKAKPGLGSKFKLSHLPFSGTVLEKTTDFSTPRLSHGPSTSSSSVAGGSVGGSGGGSGGGGSVGGPTNNNNNNTNNNSKQNNNNNNGGGGKMRRRPWSGEEKEAVFRHLGFYVLIHNVPGKEACMRCLDMEPCLRNRHWKDIKNQVHNQIESHKKQMFHCQADAPGGGGGGGGGGASSGGALSERGGGVASSSCDIIQEAELRGGGGGRKRNRAGGVAMRANEQQQHHNLDDNRGVASFRGVGVASSDHQSVERGGGGGGGGAIRNAVIGPAASASPPDSLLAIRGGGGGANHNSADPRMERGGAIIRGGASPQLERGGGVGGVAEGQLAQLQANQERQQDKYIISENQQQPIMMEPGAHMMLDCLPGADRQMERLQTLTGRQTDSRQTDEQLHVGLHGRQTGGLQLADRQVDRQTGGLQLADRQVDRQTGGLSQLSRQTDRHYLHNNNNNSRQTVRQTDRQAVGGGMQQQQQQTDRQGGGAGLQFNGQLSEAINRHLTWSPPIEQQPIPTQHYGHAHF